jgi:hypothetical protein
MGNQVNPRFGFCTSPVEGFYIRPQAKCLIQLVQPFQQRSAIGLRDLEGKLGPTRRCDLPGFQIDVRGRSVFTGLDR